MVDLFEKHFDDAHEFLDYLRPSKPHWGNIGWGKQWLFRGQGHEKWNLVPSAWREIHLHMITHPTIQTRLISLFKEKVLKSKIQNSINAFHRAMAEFTLIREFVNLADRVGFVLPRLDEWKAFSYDFIENYARGMVGDLENDKIWEHPIIALAQHHGIPTRLLDWSENPLVAAYFAILGHNMLPDSDKKLNSKIVVYAIHDSLTGKELKQITVSRAENLNLRMQEGLFLYNAKADEHYIETGKFPSIDETILSIKLDDSKIKNPYQKITLSIGQNSPNQKSVDLLRDLLERENITTSHLMPTLDNVARTVKNRFDIR